MARTTLTPQDVPTGRESSPAGIALIFTAADVANGNQFKTTGREVVVVRNTGAAGHTIAASGRAPYSGLPATNVAAGAYAALPFFNLNNWRQSGGYIFLDGNHAELEIAVLRLP